MGTTERREREKTQRRNDILDAAEEVFFSKGLRFSTMDDVAEKAELSKGTLYLYFKSKELLYLGIHLRGMEILEREFKEAIESRPDGFSKVMAIGEAYIQFANDYPNYFRAMTFYENVEEELWKEFEAEPLAQNCHETGMSLLNILIDAIKEGVRDGSVRGDLNPERTAILLWSQSNGIIQFMQQRGEHFRKYHNTEIDTIYSDYFDYTARSLKPPDK